MPVDIERFESGTLPDEPSAPEQVVTFLASHRDQAFTRAEITAAVDASPNAVGTALSRLKERGLVRHRGEYWAVTDDEERLAAAYDLHRISSQLDEAGGGIDAQAWDEAAPEERHPSERGDDE
jgi:Mn-dependent DtxR family transcriptional regulator